MTGLQEKLLLYRLKIKKDPEAFGSLYDLYVERIYRFVYFKVNSREEAEDITSEVFLRAWNYLNDDKTVKSFSGLLYRIARNLVIDFYRGRAARPVSEESQEVSDAGEWQKMFTDNLEARQVLQAVKGLKQEYQEVVTLKYVDELTVEEIAEITGRGKVAVRVTLHRALKKLKNVFPENNEV